MIQLRTIKWKHYRQAVNLQKQVEAGEAEEEEVIKFFASLVVEWDFVDGDTKQPIPLGEIDELSAAQVKELNEAVSAKIQGVSSIPKVNAGS